MLQVSGSAVRIHAEGSDGLGLKLRSRVQQLGFLFGLHMVHSCGFWALAFVGFGPGSGES